jgi:hypothetical protein
MSPDATGHEFDALKADAAALLARLRAGGIPDLRENLLLRHSLLLLSDDVMRGFALYLSIEKFKKLAANDFCRTGALESEGVFAPMLFLLNDDAEVTLGTKQAILRMAREARDADIGTLAAAVRELVKARVFYREAVLRLQEMRHAGKRGARSVH